MHRPDEVKDCHPGRFRLPSIAAQVYRLADLKKERRRRKNMATEVLEELLAKLAEIAPLAAAKVAELRGSTEQEAV